MYTSHLDLNQDNVHTLLDIAKCLQVQNVLNMCCSFLKSARALDQLDNMPCNSVLLLQSTLTADRDCADHAANLLRVCSSSEHPCMVSDDHHLQRTEPAEHNISSDTVNRQKQDDCCTDLSFKQSDCYYRLCNFYTKHFYKKATCSSSKKLPMLSSDSSASSKENSIKNASCTISQSGCILESSNSLTPAFLVQPLNEFPEDQGLKDESLQSAKQRRLTKSMCLKKLDFLHSQKSLEQSTVLKIADGDIARKAELEVQNSVKKINIGTNEQKVQHLVNLEQLEQNVELMPTRASSDLASQLHTFPSERQYPCTVCGKAFKHPSNLELHIRSHTGTIV